MTAFALNKTFESSEVYSKAAGATDRVIVAYRHFEGMPALHWVNRLVRKYYMHRIAKDIHEACVGADSLIALLDEIIERLASEGSELPEEIRRSHPFDSSYELLNGCVYGLKKMVDRNVPGARKLFVRTCIARNKAGQIASLIRQMDPPASIFDSSVDRQALLDVAQHFTSSLDSHIRH